MTNPAEDRQRREAYALMFPGQGSQFPGMGADLILQSAAARRIFERADEVLGYPLSRIMAGERGEELNRTVHTQPAIFVHSMALLAAVDEGPGLCPAMAAGHSLGEYSALCAAGVLSFDEALDIIRVRAEGMDAAQPPGTCAMAAIIGPSKETVLDLVATHRGEDVLEVANFNSPDQLVISGHLVAVKRVVEAAKGLKRTRAVMLPVSSAFHTSLMEPARDSLGKRLERAQLGKAAFPIVANVNAQPYDGAEAEIKRSLMDQVVSPVLWEDCVRTMRKSGAVHFIEIGPGKVLAGLLKRIDREAVPITISDMEGIRRFEGESG